MNAELAAQYAWLKYTVFVSVHIDAIAMYFMVSNLLQLLVIFYAILEDKPGLNYIGDPMFLVSHLSWSFFGIDYYFA